MSDNPYLDHIVSNHPLYDRYHDDWKLAQDSYLGGTEYREGRYLRAYASDTNQPSEMINTYVTNSDGSVVSRHKARLEKVNNLFDKENQDGTGTYYNEKLSTTPLYNYVKLIVSEYNSILFRTPPTRNLPDTPEMMEFMHDVDGEYNSVNEFLAQVDAMTTVFGVCHILCLKPTGSDIPRWKMYTPMDVTNWSYYYDNQGNLQLRDVVIQLEDTKIHKAYRYITRDTIETVFCGCDDDYQPPAIQGLEQIGDCEYRIVQENELGYIPMVTVYQNYKVYNNVGSTVISDVAQIQRSIYGDMAEIYSAITYGAHPTLVVDEITDQLNDGQVGAEPGSVVRVQNSVSTGEANYVYEFKAPQLDAITEIRELVDSKINKLVQIAMLRSEDLVRASRSGEQIEQFDDKLASQIRKKATNLENAEQKLWSMWADWMNIQLPGDFSVSYSRQYNKRSIEHELTELEKMIGVYERLQALSPDSVSVEVLQDIQERMANLVRSSTTDNSL
jgi:hypothetical protein